MYSFENMQFDLKRFSPCIYILIAGNTNFEEKKE